VPDAGASDAEERALTIVAAVFAGGSTDRDLRGLIKPRPSQRQRGPVETVAGAVYRYALRCGITSSVGADKAWIDRLSIVAQFEQHPGPTRLFHCPFRDLLTLPSTISPGFSRAQPAVLRRRVQEVLFVALDDDQAL